MHWKKTHKTSLPTWSYHYAVVRGRRRGRHNDGMALLMIKIRRNCYELEVDGMGLKVDWIRLYDGVLLQCRHSSTNAACLR
jgi:hypothetical protein